MQSGKFLTLLLAITMILACAPTQALTDSKEEVPSPVMRSQEFDVGKVRIRIEWIDYLKCEAKVLYRTSEMKEFKAAEQVDVSVSTEIEKRPAKLVKCGALDGNQRCETCFFMTKRNPLGYYMTIGSITYFICIYGC